MKRFKQLQQLHSPDYSDKIDHARYAPPYPGVPDYGCVGCTHRLPWHTSFHIKDEQGHSAVVDAHDCWGPEPVSDKGKKIAVDTFRHLTEHISHTLDSLPFLQRQKNNS